MDRYAILSQYEVIHSIVGSSYPLLIARDAFLGVFLELKYFL